MTELTCIVCPKGCRLRVDPENGFTVTGQGCARGEKYGREELRNPLRVVTSTVAVEGAVHRRCPVKTDGAIPKALVRQAVRALDSVRLQGPVGLGQVVVADVCGVGVNFVATKSIGGRNEEPWADWNRSQGFVV